MPKENKILKWSIYGIFAPFGMFILATLLIFAYVPLSASLPEDVLTVFGAAIFLLIVLAAALFVISLIVAVLSGCVEVISSKNNSGWRILWALVLIFGLVFPVTPLVYWFAARKDLES